MIPSTIEKRAIELMLNGMDVIAALKQAIIDEQNLIGSLINSSNQLTDRGQIASNHLFERYNTNHG